MKLSKLFARKSSHHSSDSRTRTRRKQLNPFLETLEQRVVLTTFAVSNLLDSGAGSLRQAILDANAQTGADIVDLTRLSGTILMSSSTAMTITDDLSIIGPGMDSLAIDGGDQTQVFVVNDGNSSEITVSVSDVEIRDGKSTDVGGAIENRETLQLNRVRVSSSSAINGGGGLANLTDGELTINESIISNNTVTSSVAIGRLGGSGGGGLFNFGGTVTLNRSTLTGNSAESRGGAIQNISDGSTAMMDINQSTIDNNSVTNTSFSTGGGIDNFGELGDAFLNLTSSTVSSNTSPRLTGGIGSANSGSLVTIVDSTITNNSAGVRAGGIFNNADAAVSMSNSILAGNTAGNSPDLFGVVQSQGFNIIGDTTGGSGYAATDQEDVDPLLGNLLDNGGLTRTHALLTGSPAIDAGVSLEQFDQKGDPRQSGTAVDVGSYEVPQEYDINLNQFTHGILPNLKITYEVVGAAAQPFEVSFYSSDDGRYDVRDTMIGSPLSLSRTTQLSAGSHTVEFDAAGLDTFLMDHETPFIVAVANKSSLQSETDPSNNDMYFSGMFHRSRVLAIRGMDSSGRLTTSSKDTVRIRTTGPNLVVTTNGRTVSLDPSRVTSIMALTHDGKDDVRGNVSVSTPMHIDGGDNNDILVGGEGRDTLIGNAGGDILNGRGGDDLLDGDGSSGTRGSRDIIFGGNGNDTLIGGSPSSTGLGDRLVGMAGDDLVTGSSGNDAVLGRDGDDTLNGGLGNDIVIGGRHDDLMNGEGGNDRLFGVGGHDILIGGFGADLLRGGAGDDDLNGNPINQIDREIDRIFGEQGFDRLTGFVDAVDFIKHSQIEEDLRSL